MAITNASRLADFGSGIGTQGAFTADVSIADKIIHTGDTNTAIRFPSADEFTVESGGVQRIRVGAAHSNAIGLGHYAAASSGPFVQISRGQNYDKSSLNPSTCFLHLGGEDNSFSTGYYGIGFGYIYGNPATTAPAYIAYLGTDDNGYTHGDLTFWTKDATTSNVNAIERLRIKAGGNVGIGSTIPTTMLDVGGAATFAGDVTAGAATFAGAIKADAGIDFSGAQTNQAGMTSELLDAYEEGTFTPTLTKWSPGNMSGVSYTTQQGRYTKIGDIVHVKINLSVQAGITWGTSSNAIAIDGLPFVFGTVNMALYKGYFNYQNSSTYYYPTDFLWYGYTSKIYGSIASTGNSWTTTWDGTSQLRVSFTYTTSAF